MATQVIRQPAPPPGSSSPSSAMHSFTHSSGGEHGAHITCAACASSARRRLEISSAYAGTSPLGRPAALAGGPATAAIIRASCASAAVAGAALPLRRRRRAPHAIQAAPSVVRSSTETSTVAITASAPEAARERQRSAAAVWSTSARSNSAILCCCCCCCSGDKTSEAVAASRSEATGISHGRKPESETVAQGGRVLCSGTAGGRAAVPPRCPPT
jgi:hypothetical protein